MVVSNTDVSYENRQCFYLHIYIINLNKNADMVIVEKTVATICIVCHPMRLSTILQLLLLSTIQ